MCLACALCAALEYVPVLGYTLQAPKCLRRRQRALYLPRGWRLLYPHRFLFCAVHPAHLPCAVHPAYLPSSRLVPLPPQVHLLYLRSWQGMGQAQVECASGCTCDTTLLDGHWDREATLTDLTTLKVGRAQWIVLSSSF